MGNHRGMIQEQLILLESDRDAPEIPVGVWERDKTLYEQRFQDFEQIRITDVLAEQAWGNDADPAILLRFSQILDRRTRAYVCKWGGYGYNQGLIGISTWIQGFLHTAKKLREVAYGNDAH